MPRSIRSIWLRVLSAVAMWAPSMPLRIAANRWKGVRFGTGPWIGVHAYLDIHHSHPDPANCLVFGDNVAIGNNVSIFTHDSLYNRITAGRDPIEWGHVRTGSHVNISPHSFLYNCTIGDHSIIAPGSVVANAEFPSYSLIAGNPAKVVKDLRERVEGRAPRDDVIALRFDIDTRRGLAVQTPPLLDLLDEFGVLATFFCVMGREANLQEIVRLRLLAPSESKSRLNVEAKGGPVSVLKAALRPRWVGSRNQELLRDIVDRGHELQPHGWSHIRWQRSIDRIDVAEHLRLATEALEAAIGRPATGWAAPGRTTSEAALHAIDAAGLVYSGDLEGDGPFVPAGHRHVQLPLTRFETIAQMRQRGLSDERIVATYLSDVDDHPDYCCLYEHPDDLGPAERDIIREVLRAVRERGRGFTTLEPVARAHLASIG